MIITDGKRIATVQNTPNWREQAETQLGSSGRLWDVAKENKHIWEIGNFGFDTHMTGVCKGKRCQLEMREGNFGERIHESHELEDQQWNLIRWQKVIVGNEWESGIFGLRVGARYYPRSRRIGRRRFHLRNSNGKLTDALRLFPRNTRDERLAEKAAEEGLSYHALTKEELVPWKCWIGKDKIEFEYHHLREVIQEKVDKVGREILRRNTKTDVSEMEEDDAYRWGEINSKIEVKELTGLDTFSKSEKSDTAFRWRAPVAGGAYEVIEGKKGNSRTYKVNSGDQAGQEMMVDMNGDIMEQWN
jgi:hypothetical protein